MLFLKEFSKCPICYSKETVCRLACADEPSIQKDVFVSLDKVFTPIQDISKVVSPLVRGILVHYDVCANCGTRYCTRAEVVSAPVSVQQAPIGNPPQFDPKSHRRL